MALTQVERRMSDPKSEPKTLTAADAAKLVKRPVLVPAKAKGGEPTVEMVSVKAGEVLAFKDYGSHVVVVTTDGQKFSSAAEA
jgi:hypothetical protein